MRHKKRLPKDDLLASQFCGPQAMCGVDYVAPTKWGDSEIASDFQVSATKSLINFLPKEDPTHSLWQFCERHLRWCSHIACGNFVNATYGGVLT
jgi:hypothetical protein